jgi:CubicO group peptidase (beta-lactamase class C family)
LKDGKPVKARGYGVANLELGTGATPETVYQIGSIRGRPARTGR